MTLRTSDTHPLRIDRILPDTGQIGMTICPGKIGPSVSGEQWERDLSTDLDLILDQGVSMVVTLMELGELSQYYVHSIGDEVRKRGMSWVYFPFADKGVPADSQKNEWLDASAKIHDALKRNEVVLIHCLGGLGRTGTVASMVLQDLGLSVQSSFTRIRNSRPGTIETPEQETFLEGYMDWRKAG